MLLVQSTAGARTRARYKEAVRDGACPRAPCEGMRRDCVSLVTSHRSHDHRFVTLSFIEKVSVGSWVKITRRLKQISNVWIGKGLWVK